MFYLDEARNGVHPSVAAPTDPGTEQLGAIGGRGSAGGPAGHVASAEGSGPNPGTGVQVSGERYSHRMSGPAEEMQHKRLTLKLKEDRNITL